ncbi:hypothetical protein ABGA94_06680, partial [Stenotrophomonas sp. 3diitr2024]
LHHPDVDADLHLLLLHIRLRIEHEHLEGGLQAEVQRLAAPAVGSFGWLGHVKAALAIVNFHLQARHIAIEDATKGHDKVTTFNLEPTGKGGRNVKITQDYSVKYG